MNSDDIPKWNDIPKTHLIKGECIEKMREMESCSVDAILTDPPYGLSPDGKARTWDDIDRARAKGGFMGRSWDAAVPGVSWARECLRILKPGGYIMAFGSTRTIHRLACGIEDAGFEIRDMISWLYFSGFPKNHDVSKAIDKQAGAEREIIGQWTPTGTARPNVGQKGHGAAKTTAAIKDYQAQQKITLPITKPATEDAKKWEGYGTALKPAQEPAILARKPLEKGLSVAQNVLKWGVGAINIDSCRFGYGDPCWVGPQSPSGLSPYARKVPQRRSQAANHNHVNYTDNPRGRWPANIYQCPKASRTERDAGLEHLEGGLYRNSLTTHNGTGDYRGFDKKPLPTVRNIHPTVKPLKLMRWAARLIGAQKGSVILDPFLGSGTTAVACMLEGFESIGIEMTEEYYPIIEGRLNWAREQYKRENAQLSLWG